MRCRAPNVWDADDLTATVFTRALEKYHLFRGEAPVAVWLFRIAHNAFIDYIRTRNKYVLAVGETESLAAPDCQPEDQYLKLEELERLQHMLDMMAPDQRDVVLLRYIGELRFGQIARVLEKTETAVRMIHHRSLKILRAKLSEER